MLQFLELLDEQKVAQRPSWHEMLVRFLLGAWESECRRAERPDRKVPYY